MKKYYILFAILLMGMIMGFAIAQITTDWKQERMYNGWHFTNTSREHAETFSKDSDDNGDWVCVNVKGMDFETALQTCRHETGHEIFAEYCDESNDNFEKCEEVVR